MTVCVMWCVAQGNWSAEEMDKLREVYVEVCAGVSGDGMEEEKELVRMVMMHFPNRGIRDVTQQLKQEGHLVQRSGGGERRKEAEGEGRNRSK